MKRAICSYRRDERHDWIAVLDCHHGQHVRHRPPFTNRPWVTTEDGRNRMLGASLECLRCDRFELPEGLEHYRSTPVFTAETVPAGLVKDHTTKKGVWGVIRVTSGQLAYVAGPLRQQVNANGSAIVVPEMRHHVEPGTNVSFQVDFYRAPLEV